MKGLYEITPKEQGHFRIGSKMGVFMDLFVGKEHALLFDTGYGFGNLKEEVRSLTDLPLYIVNSHGHVDHTCGNFQFEETVYIHEQDMEMCRVHTGEQMRKGAVANARNMKDEHLGVFGDILPNDFQEEQYLKGGAGNLAPVKEGDSFDLGGVTLTVYEMKGHTPGSIGLLWEEEKTLMVGDAMNPFLWLFMPEALTLDDYRRTLVKIWSMDFSHFYMSHSLEREKKETMVDYMETARDLDYEQGVSFDSPLAAGLDARICTRKGYGVQDMGKPGFASIVISKGHF